MEIPVREAFYGSCPYLPARSWQVEEFTARSLAPAFYEKLLVSGWRRSGSTFYMDTCSGCARCIPIRLDAAVFKPSRSQRRILRRNGDIERTVAKSEFSDERFSLYRRYVSAQHGAVEGPETLLQASYASFLLGGPLGSTAIIDYRLRSTGALVANGYVDILPGGLSSVYFTWEPLEAGRSLGTWSVLSELALAVELGLGYYYLGFWVPGSMKMDYKSGFRPFEIAIEGSWIPVRDRAEALEKYGSLRLSRGDAR